MEKDISSRVYALKDNVVIIPFRDEGLQILAYGREFIFKGRVATALIPCVLKHMHGEETVAQVCDKVCGELGTIVEKDVVVKTIKSLEQQSLLREVSAPPSLPLQITEKFREQLDFFAAFEKSGNAYQARLQAGHVGVFALGEMTEPMLRALLPLGIGQVSLFTYRTEAPAHLDAGIRHHSLPDLELSHLIATVSELKLTHIVGVASAISSQLWENLNALAFHYKIPMTRVELGPLRAEIGPTVLPGRSACYHCFDLRRRSLKINYEEYKNLETHLGKEETLPPFRVHPLFREITAGLAACEIMRVVSGYFYPQTYNQVILVDFFTLELSKNQVLKIPRCPVCSPINQKPMKEVYPKILGGGNV